MSLFVYIAQSCIDDAIAHGCKSQLDKFAADVENEQRLNRFSEDFPYPYLVKKQFTDRNRRLIAEQKDVQGHLVVCLLRIMIRGDDEYEKEFQRDPKDFGERRLAHLVDQDELISFVSMKATKEPEEQRGEPTQDEYLLLTSALSQCDYSNYVCESEEWKTIVSSSDQIKDRLILYPALIRKAIEEADPNKYIYNRDDDQSVGIVCRWFTNTNKLLLVLPFYDGAPNQQVVDKYKLLIEVPSESVTEEDLLKNSVRAYPDLVLYGSNDDMWMIIQKDEKANMALSPEESEILESVIDKGFPLFINGRAGSGKSTLLQYLFAEFLTYYFEKADRSQLDIPIFFTCNRKLLDNSRRQVLDLVIKNHKRLIDSDGADIDVDPIVINNAFQEFHEHLHALLSVIDKQRFSHPRYIDYAKFKQYWLSKYAKDPKALNNYGPDISWHVIRTYIKGISSDDYFDPNDYCRLPKKERTVTHETFSNVYDQVWSWYRKECEDKGLWDDQDLVRFILDNDLALPKHPAIFCDESQDFTKIELELILRLNLYSDRAVPEYMINKVPFVFAGDPFQTLNPTGFRWEAIKASFVSKFIYSLSATARRGNEELNYQELRYNYRSNASIVKFCNTIQAVRSILFDIKEIEPQHSWQNQRSSSMPVWFDSNSSDVKKQLKDQADLTIIVPCLEGEEACFVANDQLLKEVVNIDEAGVPQNVFSASRVKGLEYNRVVLYGFGKQCVNDSINIVDALKDRAVFEDPDSSLPVEYFLNRLYVAASRPMKQLIIIDSVEGVASLWNIMMDEGLRVNSVIPRLRRNDVWLAEIGGMVKGHASDWANESKERPEKLAEKYEEDGLARRDSSFLRSASMYYQQAGIENKTRECKARALDLEGSFVEAGNILKDIGMYEDALLSFWKAGDNGYKGIIQTAELNPEISKRVDFKIVNNLNVKKLALDDVQSTLQLFLAEMSHDRFLGSVLSDPNWQENIGKLVRRITAKNTDHKEVPKWQALSAIIGQIAKKGIILPQNEIALVYFMSGEYRAAVEAWDNTQGAKRDEYHIAKAKLDPFPENLDSLARLDEIETIIEQHKLNSEVALSPHETRIIAKAYTKKRDYQSAFELVRVLQDASLAFDVLLGSIKSDNKSLAVTICCELPGILLESNKLNESLSFVDTGKWPGLQTLGLDRKIKEIVTNNSRNIQIAFVKAIARSSSLSSRDVAEKKSISDYLDKLFKSLNSWAGSIPAYVAGAAFENAGRIMSAIRFYEDLQNSAKFSDDEKKFAAIRWIKCKEKMALLDIAKSGGHETTSSVRHMKDALAKSKDIKIDMQSIPELPDLSVMHLKPEILPDKPDTVEPNPPPPISTPQGPKSLQQERLSISLAGRFNIDIDRKLNKFRIEHIESMEIMTVDLSNINFRKAPIDIHETTPGIFEGQEWGVEIDLTGHKTEGEMLIKFPASGIRMSFDV